MIPFSVAVRTLASANESRSGGGFQEQSMICLPQRTVAGEKIRPDRGRTLGSLNLEGCVAASLPSQ